MQTRWLTRATYLYLTFPFIIFCMGWLRLSIAIPVTAIILWVLWLLWTQSSGDFGKNRADLHSLVPAILVAGLWVLLSGVGGYAFQNWDHHWRNAVLRDLINFDWPVVYSSAERGPFKMLIYYVGDWLPAALAGKLLGWKFANFILFLWTWLGLLLVVLNLSKGGTIPSLQKTSPLKIILFLIFFSGMDALGMLLLAPDYPSLFPAIQHLEIWAGDLQYSSFTTGLFWVFNQAVMAWLCISIFISLGHSLGNSATLQLQKALPQSDTRGLLSFIWSLCFFFAPLASIGLLPYLLIEWIKQTDIKKPFKDIRFGLLFASAIIVIVSYLFFSSNAAAQERGFQSIAIKDLLIFFLLEGGILWLFLAPRLWHNPYWMVTGLLLFFIPFIQLGSGRDFVMRASIAPLFYLMIMCGEAVFQNTTPRLTRLALTVILLIGALTPLYEINRSIYRTFEYYFVLDEDQRSETPPAPPAHLEQAGALEYEHPNSLAADDIVTLQFMDDKLSRNFIANVRPSLYYRYLSPR
ncbi:MAG: hypothetical protein C4586_02995 [Anaerolineaceae bacterium]|nr:MAG: hypothetical protein C4586_02995 [Anaerolineaceae bacterium]